MSREDLWDKAINHDIIQLQFAVTGSAPFKYPEREVTINRGERVYLGRTSKLIAEQPTNLFFDVKPISNRHGYFELYSGTGLVFVDQSRNGTRINRLKATSGKHNCVNVGDVFTLGSRDSKIKLTVTGATGITQPQRSIFCACGQPEVSTDDDFVWNDENCSLLDKDESDVISDYGVESMPKVDPVELDLLTKERTSLKNLNITDNDDILVLAHYKKNLGDIPDCPLESELQQQPQHQQLCNETPSCCQDSAIEVLSVKTTDLPLHCMESNQALDIYDINNGEPLNLKQDHSGSSNSDFIDSNFVSSDFLDSDFLDSDFVNSDSIDSDSVNSDVVASDSIDSDTSDLDTTSVSTNLIADTKLTSNKPEFYKKSLKRKYDDEHDDNDHANKPRIPINVSVVPQSKIRKVSRVLLTLGAGAVIGSIGTIVGLAASAE